MSCLKKLKKEISFSLAFRRERTSRRLREVTAREKKLFQFRNSLDMHGPASNQSSRNQVA